jgi:hypothetical protein
MTKDVVIKKNKKVARRTLFSSANKQLGRNQLKKKARKWV